MGRRPRGASVSAAASLAASYTFRGAACSLAGSNLLLNGPAVCGVTAHPAGDSNYNPAADVGETTTVGSNLYLPLVIR